MCTLKHELWVDPDGSETFCLAGKMGDDARSLLPLGSKLVWCTEARSHFEAMTKYYIYADRGEYETTFDWDFKPYPEDWLKLQNSS